MQPFNKVYFIYFITHFLPKIVCTFHTLFVHTLHKLKVLTIIYFCFLRVNKWNTLNTFSEYHETYTLYCVGSDLVIKNPAFNPTTSRTVMTCYTPVMALRIIPKVTAPENNYL